MKIKLTYFKASGKLYTSCEDYAPDTEFWNEIRERLENIHSLPGLTSNWNTCEFIIVAENLDTELKQMFYPPKAIKALVEDKIEDSPTLLREIHTVVCKARFKAVKE